MKSLLRIGWATVIAAAVIFLPLRVAELALASAEHAAAASFGKGT